jgi:hypothetical protein
MNSVTLISTRLDLFGACRDVVLNDWGKYAVAAKGMFQIRDECDRLLTVFDFDNVYWDCFELPAVLSNLGEVAACEIECRWLDLFVAVTERLAEAVSPLWICDDDGALVEAWAVGLGGFRL